MPLEIKENAGKVSFAVKVVPGSSRSRVAGLLGEALKVNLAAPPEKGKANKALVELLAQILGIPRGQIAVAAGEFNPRKEVTIAGLTSTRVHELLRPHLDAGGRGRTRCRHDIDPDQTPAPNL
jgi:uncharacterized protein